MYTSTKFTGLDVFVLFGIMLFIVYNNNVSYVTRAVYNMVIKPTLYGTTRVVFTTVIVVVYPSSGIYGIYRRSEIYRAHNVSTYNGHGMRLARHGRGSLQSRVRRFPCV